MYKIFQDALSFLFLGYYFLYIQILKKKKNHCFLCEMLILTSIFLHLGAQSGGKSTALCWRS